MRGSSVGDVFTSRGTFELGIKLLDQVSLTRELEELGGTLKRLDAG